MNNQELIKNCSTFNFAITVSLFIVFLCTASLKSNPIVDSLSAKKVAFNFINKYVNEMYFEKSISIEEIFYDMYSNPLYYFINIGDSAYVVVSGNRFAKPILVFSKVRNWRKGDLNGLPEGVLYFFNLYSQEIEELNKKEIIGIKFNEEWAELENDSSFTKFKINSSSLEAVRINHWGQKRYYNSLCPGNGTHNYSHYDYKCPTGCVATAMGIIMKFWEWPLNGSGSNSYSDPSNNALNLNNFCNEIDASYGQQSVTFSNFAYNWQDMPNELNSSTGYNNEVAKILYHAGVSVNMDYAYCLSGARTTGLVSAFKDNFKYSSSAQLKDASFYTWSNWESMLRGEIDMGRPVLYTGQTSVWPWAAAGHAFVCYGYMTEGTNTLFRFNWGWDGLHNNNYYALRAITGQQTIDFNVNQKMITNLFPNYITVPSSPTLASPANNATNIATNPTLTWNASTGATSYTLQVSTSSTFTSFVFNQSNLTSTSRQITGLTNNTLYYWRVSATNAAGTSGWSAVWNFRTTAAAPSPPTLASPANNATNIATNPTLTWNASTGATSYTLQVSTSSTFTSFVFNQSNLTSTSRQITGLTNNTLYYWRVSATNSAGTSGWSSVWSFRTLMNSVPSSGLTSPVVGNIVYHYPPTNCPQVNSTTWGFCQHQTGGHTSTGGVNQANDIFAWDCNLANNLDAGKDVFPVEDGWVSHLPGWAGSSVGQLLIRHVTNGNTWYSGYLHMSNITPKKVTENSFISKNEIIGKISNVSPNPMSEHLHFAVYYHNGSNLVSVDRTFNERSAPPLSPILSSPANNATNIATNPTLTWNASTGATSYTLQVSTSSSFTSFVFNQSNLTSTSRQITGLTNNTLYYWRVSATNAAGTSGWSTVWNFRTTVAAPSPPTLASPANNATNIATNPTLTWNASTGATSYTLQVSTSSSFTSFVFNQSNLTSTSRQITGLTNNTLYYWRVSATNAAGTSGWSAVWNFRTTVAAPSPPTLASPANNATNIATNPTLTWNASTGATSYTLQVSTSSSFTSFVFNQSNLTSTSRQITGLTNNTLYYWRVSATNAAGTSGWSAVWNFRTTPAAPSPPTLASPANNATNIATNPTLTWNASTGATSYTLQVSTSSSFTSFVFNQSNLTSTSRQITGLTNNTLYYWRVSATNAAGTSGWSTVWNFRTTVAAPSPPTLASPANNATNIATNPTLTWNASTGATSYTLQVSTSSSFTSFVFNQSNLTSTSRQITGLTNNTLYYWRVSATNAAGTSGWSTVWNFRTTVAAPSPPTLASPANNATNIATNPTLTWNASTGATSYTLQVSTSSSFTSFVFNQSNLTSTSRQITGLTNNTLYYWRVSATNAAGTSGWSAVWNFRTTVAAPSPPTLASPANNATNIATNPTLTWNASTGATSYTLQVSTSSSFTSFVFNQSNLTSTSRQITGLTNNTLYYWRVSATNAAGTSGWSAVWNFRTTVAAPSPPTLASPANNATNIATNPTLTWNASTGATSYTLQVSTSSSFTSFVFNQSNLTSTSRQITGLTNNTLYYWRVSATNAAGTSGWSAVWNFRTTVAAPSPPTLASPANNATNIATNPTLTWNASTGATSYTLQVSTSSSFTSFVFNQSNLTSTSRQITGLTNNTLYYWRVSATNAAGTSGWSAVRNFKTITGKGEGEMFNLKSFVESGFEVAPNPFKNSTKISISLPFDGNTSILVMDMNGKVVKILASGMLKEGVHIFEWYPTNEVSGSYICILKFEDYVSKKKLIYIK